MQSPPLDLVHRDQQRSSDPGRVVSLPGDMDSVVSKKRCHGSEALATSVAQPGACGTSWPLLPAVRRGEHLALTLSPGVPSRSSRRAHHDLPHVFQPVIKGGTHRINSTLKQRKTEVSFHSFLTEKPQDFTVQEMPFV